MLARSLLYACANRGLQHSLESMTLDLPADYHLLPITLMLHAAGHVTQCPKQHVGQALISTTYYSSTLVLQKHNLYLVLEPLTVQISGHLIYSYVSNVQ